MLITQKRKYNFWDLAKISFAVLLLGYVLSKTNFSQLIQLREQFSWEWFALTFLLFAVMIVVKALQYYYLLEKRLSYSRIFEIVIMQNALMNFVATAAGIASYLTVLGLEKNVRLGRATVSFILVKVGDLIAVVFFLLLSLAFIKPIPDVAIRIMVTILVLSLLILFFFFMVVLYRRRFLNLFQKVITLLRLDQLNIVQRIVHYLDSLVEYDQRKVFRLISTAVLISLVYMGITMAWGYARLRMFSFIVDFEIVVFVLSLLQIASWIPVFVLGGLGISETLSIYIFGVLGENRVELAAVLIGVRLVIYLMNASTLLYLPIGTMIKPKNKTP